MDGIAIRIEFIVERINSENSSEYSEKRHLTNHIFWLKHIRQDL